jgi:hypothetical protein
MVIDGPSGAGGGGKRDSVRGIDGLWELFSSLWIQTRSF